VHTLPVPQGVQVSPPQSVSLSSWFFTPSLQLGASHTRSTQRWLEQSSGTRQAWLGSQLPPQAVPQSVSVSSPFLTPSLQVGS
jgi:hypothetical protein